MVASVNMYQVPFTENEDPDETVLVGKISECAVLLVFHRCAKDIFSLDAFHLLFDRLSITIETCKTFNDSVA